MMTPDQYIKQWNDRNDKMRESERTSFLWSYGIATNGIAHTVIFRDEDDRRDEKIALLRRQGFRYKGQLKAWFCNCPAVGVESYPVDFNDLIEFGHDGRYHFRSDARTRLVEKLIKEMGRPATCGGFVGQLKERISLDVQMTGHSLVPCKNSDFGDFEVLYFKDKDGNHLSWFQRTYASETVAAFQKRCKSKELHIVATVKRQATRMGVPVTELSRCEISCAGHYLHDFAVARRVKAAEEKALAARAD